MVQGPAEKEEEEEVRIFRGWRAIVWAVLTDTPLPFILLRNRPPQVLSFFFLFNLRCFSVMCPVRASAENDVHRSQRLPC